MDCCEERLVINDVKCGLRCSDSTSLKNLLHDAPSPAACWKCDVPSQRIVLTVKLSSRSDPAAPAVQLRRVVLRCTGVTHMELRSCRRRENEFSPETKGAVLLPKTAVVTMFEHKKALGCGSERLLSSSGSDSDASAWSASRVHALRVPEEVPAAQQVELTLLCSWEPLVSISLFALEFCGTPATLPSAAPLARIGDERAPPAAVVVRKAHQSAESTFGARDSAEPPRKAPRLEDASAVSALPSPGSLNAAGDASVASDPAYGPVSTPLVAPPPPSAPLRGCVVVLSGFVNPLRGELRDKCLSLGATCRSAWDAECTHLIAVTASTPKSAEVIASGHGYVVSKSWLLDAVTSGCRQKEQPYLLVAAPSGEAPRPTTTATGAAATPAAAADAPPALPRATKPFRFVM